MDKIWEIFLYIILGLTQGISEIMPISSSAHLIILEKLLGIESSSLFLEMLLHLASALAVIFFYRQKIAGLIKGSIRYLKGDKQYYPQLQLTLSLLIASLPAAIIGLLFLDVVSSLLTHLLFVGSFLIITSLIIFITSSLKPGTKEEVTYQDALTIGCAQAIGVIPGISRSAITLAAATSCKIKKEQAADFVFLLFLPVALGSGLLSIIDYCQHPDAISVPAIIAFLVALFATYFSLTFFLNLIRHGQIKKYSYYTLVLGILVILSNLLF